MSDNVDDMVKAMNWRPPVCLPMKVHPLEVRARQLANEKSGTKPVRDALLGEAGAQPVNQKGAPPTLNVDHTKVKEESIEVNVDTLLPENRVLCLGDPLTMASDIAFGMPNGDNWMTTVESGDLLLKMNLGANETVLEAVSNIPMLRE